MRSNRDCLPRSLDNRRMQPVARKFHRPPRVVYDQAEEHLKVPFLPQLLALAGGGDGGMSLVTGCLEHSPGRRAEPDEVPTCPNA